jgi:peptidoglycan/LPS O-acetylase OafA/YrhL
VAAFSVFFTHVTMLWRPKNPVPGHYHFGERAVIIFFALSGFVISYATFRREREPRAYVIARLSRLYSVVLPALILTAVLQIVGTALHPAAYVQYDRGYDAIRYAITALFLQSVWFTSTAPATNGPFWSLSYEFWYYGLFGAAVLIKSRPWKIGAVLAVALACGPNVLLLLPIWLFGAGSYFFRDSIRLPKAVSILVLLPALAAAVVAGLYLPDWPFSRLNLTLLYSSAFITDLLFGFFVALVIWLFDQAFRDATLPDRLVAAVRWLGDHTFSLYLYHFPLLIFLGSIIPFDRSNPLIVNSLIPLPLAIIFGLSVFTESRRPWWRQFFAALWDGAAKRAWFLRTQQD